MQNKYITELQFQTLHSISINNKMAASFRQVWSKQYVHFPDNRFSSTSTSSVTSWSKHALSSLQHYWCSDPVSPGYAQCRNTVPVHMTSPRHITCHLHAKQHIGYTAGRRTYIPYSHHSNTNTMLRVQVNLVDVQCYECRCTWLMQTTGILCPRARERSWLATAFSLLARCRLSAAENSARNTAAIESTTMILTLCLLSNTGSRSHTHRSRLS